MARTFVLASAPEPMVTFTSPHSTWESSMDELSSSMPPTPRPTHEKRLVALHVSLGRNSVGTVGVS